MLQKEDIFQEEFWKRHFFSWAFHFTEPSLIERIYNERSSAGLRLAQDRAGGIRMVQQFEAWATLGCVDEERCLPYQ